MARNTITDVRAVVEQIDKDTSVSLSFQCWGVGTNKYQLINEETGETYGPICHGATEFLKLLRGFQSGHRVA